jgi:hypothetical protein
VILVAAVVLDAGADINARGLDFNKRVAASLFGGKFL